MDETISIRYEGGDAVGHAIDLNELGISLQGFARILSVCGNFVETGRFVQHLDSLSVKVTATEPDQHRCYEVVAHVQALLANGNLWSGAGGAVLAAIVGYVLSRRSGEEMKHLKDALDRALDHNSNTTAKLIATIDKMAEALRPAARNAMHPIGRTCNSVDLYAGDTRFANLDQETRNYFSQTARSHFGPTQKWEGVISELDVRTGSCKVSFDNTEMRYQAEITDPIRSAVNNAYALALANQSPLAFMAKAEFSDEGDIIKLYISDLA